MSNPWFRMYAEAVDDDKLRLLAFEDRWHFVAILCLKTQGTLDNPEHLDRRVAVKLGLGLREADEVRRRLMEVGLVDEHWQPVKWDDRQFKSDTSRERTRAYRDRIKRHGDVTVTAQETDTDTDTETTTTPPTPPRGKPKKPPRAESTAAPSLPDWLPKESWDAYQQHRIDIKKTLTKKAAELAIRELGYLRSLGNDPVAVIEQSILNGWRGLFALKHARNGYPNGSNRAQTKHERQLEIANEIRSRAQQHGDVQDGRGTEAGATIEGVAETVG